MPVTNAATDKLYGYLGFQPNTDINEGVKEMVEWYKQYPLKIVLKGVYTRHRIFYHANA